MVLKIFRYSAQRAHNDSVNYTDALVVESSTSLCLMLTVASRHVTQLITCE